MQGRKGTSKRPCSQASSAGPSSVDFKLVWYPPTASTRRVLTCRCGANRVLEVETSMSARTRHCLDSSAGWSASLTRHRTRARCQANACLQLCSAPVVQADVTVSCCMEQDCPAATDIKAVEWTTINSKCSTCVSSQMHAEQTLQSEASPAQHQTRHVVQANK